ncbi:zinc finger MYM-type protein 1-like [Melanaphis sacchari]|uniref:zinc finger MYM-type protein 1-like n=1 Tax=Melanaphis sacchari TaxID=742174 RepID=UPI000DC144EE|nr:zinc finger MYM-type protein 1-like [Melanaphis sacchari]
MSGVYSGLQARIKHTQPLALYVHCAAHNLNLVINDSVKNITEIQNFYEKLECLYSYFANSIKRWAHLKSVSSVSISLKRLCTTRWSSRNDCLKALSLLYVDILKLLAYISLMGRNKDEKGKASGLQNYFQKFDVILIIVIESKILNSLQIVSLLLQKSDIDLLKAFELLQTALNKIKEMRDKFEEVFEEAKQIAILWGVEPTFTKIRKTKTTKYFDELSNDERLHDAEQYFKTQIYYRTLDIIIKQLEHRFNGMNQVIKRFSSILPINICSMNENELKHLTTSLVNNYENDLTIDLVNQIIQFKRSGKFSRFMYSLFSFFDNTSDGGERRKKFY